MTHTIRRGDEFVALMRGGRPCGLLPGVGMRASGQVSPDGRDGPCLDRPRLGAVCSGRMHSDPTDTGIPGVRTPTPTREA